MKSRHSSKPRSASKAKTGAGKGPAAGVGYQSQVAAWFAVLALARKPPRNTFGIGVNAYPVLLQQEQRSRFPIDDITVCFEPSGRLLIQATTDLKLSFGNGKKPSKLRKSLLQAIETWHRLKSAEESTGYQQPLSRSQDAIIIAVPRGSPGSLRALDEAFRKFEGVDRWSDAGLEELNAEARAALDQAVEIVRSACKDASGTEPQNDDLVELLGLIRIVCIEVEQGEHDQNEVVALLREHILAEPSQAPHAWTHLVRESQKLAQAAGGINRAGLERNLAQAGYALKVAQVEQAPQLEQSAQIELGDAGQVVQEFSARLPSDENILPAYFAEIELSKALRRARHRVSFKDESVDYTKEMTALAQRVIAGDLRRAPAQLRYQVIDFAARANIAKDTEQSARELLAVAKSVYPAGAHDIAEAMLIALSDADRAMQRLRSLNRAQAKSQLFNLVLKTNGSDAAHQWITDHNLTPADLTPIGSMNVLTNSLFGARDFPFAAAWAEQTPEVIHFPHWLPSAAARSASARRKTG
jgi:hypothetical protein